MPGATVNFGKRGARTTLGIPGTGLSYGVYSPYQKNSGAGDQPQLRPTDSPSVKEPSQPGVGNIEQLVASAPTEQLASGTLKDVQDLIERSSEQRSELSTARNSCASDLDQLRHRLRRRQAWYGFLLFWINPQKLQSEIEGLSLEIESLDEAMEASTFDVMFELDDGVMAVYEEVGAAYDRLKNCAKIWDITSRTSIDKRMARSLADRSVARERVSFSRQSYPAIRKTSVPCLHNANGGDIFIFPFFLLVESGRTIALVDYFGLTIDLTEITFTEEEDVPSDAEIVGHTWAKTNANGSPDRRFKDNYKIPQVKYGEIELYSSNGLHEAWQASNFQAMREFVVALRKWQNLLKTIGSKPTARQRDKAPTTPKPQDAHERMAVVLNAVDESYLDWCLDDLEIDRQTMTLADKVSSLSKDDRVTPDWLLSDLKVNQLRAISVAVFDETKGNKADLAQRIKAYLEA